MAEARRARKRRSTLDSALDHACGGSSPCVVRTGGSAFGSEGTFTLNFVKFTSWPALRSGEAILVCVASEDSMSDAIAQAFNGQMIDGHSVRVTRLRAEAGIRDCQLLFISAGESRRFAATLEEASRLPILTISDSDGATSRGAIVEFFTEHDRLRFAINMDALDRSRLKVSSRLLSLAKPAHNVDLP